MNTHISFRDEPRLRIMSEGQTGHCDGEYVLITVFLGKPEIEYNLVGKTNYHTEMEILDLRLRTIRILRYTHRLWCSLRLLAAGHMNLLRTQLSHILSIRNSDDLTP